MRHLIYTTTIISMLIFVGCGRQDVPKDLPPTFPQRIIIMQEGNPVADVVVGLHPIEESKWNASALTNASGVAEMRTHGMYRGVVEGKYKVTLSKEDAESREAGRRPDGMSITETTFYSLVELKYTQADTTPLEIEVTRRNDPVTFDIGPAVRELILVSR